MTNIVSAIGKWSIQKSGQEAYLYLADGENEAERITYAELDQKARQIAAYLSRMNMHGQRILLLYPSGIDFIVSFIGCLYAGAIAVPAACPRPEDFQKSTPLLQLIARDAGISGVFTQKHMLQPVNESSAQWMPEKKIFVADTSQINTTARKVVPVPLINDETIAYLQYTSGSTSTPKAAIVRHGNLKHSLKHSVKAWGYTRKSITLTWAPHSHVYGLVCGLLLPLYHGTPSIIMPVSAFIRRPSLWLKAVSRYKVTHTGCPNFGYERCVKDIPDSEMAGVSLKAWKVAVNGGENVSHNTLMQFCDKFRRHGFSLKNFNSAFGMSEASGLIAASTYGHEPVFFNLSSDELKHNQVKMTDTGRHKTFACNGRLLPGLEAVVADPETFQPVGENRIGEIWLRGKSIVSGYWQREEETRAVFQARLAGSDQHYFRTGDLGFIHDGELCLTGRLKEIIVVKGKKYYPLDLEDTIAAALKPMGAIEPRVAASLTVAENDEVIIFQEVTENDTSMDKLNTAIRHAITRHYGIDVHTVVLVRKNGIPKTSSGKLQRKLCVKQFLEHVLPVISVYEKNETDGNVTKTNTNDAQFNQIISSVLKISVADIDYQAPLSRYGFDSISIIQLTSLLNECYGLTLSPAALYEYQTLGQFHDHIIAGRQVSRNNAASVSREINGNDIAIIGISGIFPGARDTDAFWDLLIQGRHAISEIPSSRWDWKEFFGDPHGETNKTSIKWGAFIDNIDCFDAEFFSISPREAELTDPQQRIFLQTVWNTIEDAGYSASSLSIHKTGLYVGVFNHDYAELMLNQGIMDAYSTTATSPSILANRVSYVLNLSGPSEAIDTACSSSLVAIHHAVRAIQNGDCELAIAGGVNALLSPASFISASKAGMLSVDGCCKTFDRNANGFVRGEGVAAVLLKKLSNALADHDHIYGVIKGTAVNHGGHVNTLTAPNPNAQAEVIMAAHKRAGISIDSVNYIETHGTGTSLGDPIEINGLKKAFRMLAEEQGRKLAAQSCGLGAVKTNIGHLESAAGIAGLIKILLALQHEQLPPNMHFNLMNPYIDLEESPFYLLNQARPWQRNPAAPRRAGLSSFGFGGTNAHIVIEEAPQHGIKDEDQVETCHLFALSAKNGGALRQKLKDLHGWLARQKNPPLLSALSFTLNTGRMHFSSRCAIIAASIQELQVTLAQVLHDEQPENYISGADTSFTGGSQSDSRRAYLFAEGHNYVRGQNPDWEQIHGHSIRQRISLPAYPFAGTRYWLPLNQLSAVTVTARLHELLDANTSTLESQCFVKLLTGTEKYLSGHKIKNDMILPGALYLEMARTAASLALPGKKITGFRDIAWLKALKHVKATQLTIHLCPEDRQLLRFEVSADTAVYAHGKIAYLNEPAPVSSAPALNLHDLSKRLPVKRAGHELYPAFAAAGLNYGEAFQLIRQAASSDSEVLARLEWRGLNDPLAQINLLDGVLHAAMTLLLGKRALYLPQSIGKITIYGSLTMACYAYIRLQGTAGTTPVFDIQACDEEGRLLLEIKDFMVCEALSEQNTGIYCYSPVWKVVEPSHDGHDHLNNKSILLFSDPETASYIQRQLPDCRIKRAASVPDIAMMHPLPEYIIYHTRLSTHDRMSEEEINSQLQQTYYTLFHLAKALLQHKQRQKIRLMIVNESRSVSLFTQALTGFALSLQDEYPDISCRVIQLENREDLISELTQRDIEVRRGQGHKRLVKQYQELPAAPEILSTSLLRQNGIYLISGGLGGLGLNFARYLAGYFQAKLILFGRSSLDDNKQKLLAELNQQGGEAHYYSADVCDRQDMLDLAQKIKARHGSINGIIHAAGVIQDGFLRNKTEQESKRVISPKINGTIYLDEATSSEILDFIVLFSSVTSIFGNAGQCDYGYANSFMDSFAEHREGLRMQGKRHGKTVAVNWPLWQDAAHHLGSESLQHLEHSLGIIPLATEDGIRMFLHAIAQDNTQFIVLPGNKPKLERALSERNRVSVTQFSPEISLAHDHALRQQTVDLLKQLLSAVIRTAPEKIHEQAAFETYGIDSLMVIQLNQELEKVFGTLSKTLFFEYQNLSALTDYFLQFHASTLGKIVRIQDEPKSALPNAASNRFIQAHVRLPAKTETTGNNDIAIIGLSGRYPKARNVEEFWENLKSGRDCITEIPDDRWDHGRYYDADPGQPGKSYSRWGGFLDDVAMFDPLFFNISPREAELMDPQERIFLQTAWHTLEDAGYTRESLSGTKTGVFVGVMYGHYQLFSASEGSPANSIFSSIANRVSYYFDFRGPSMALDTMCSSSLTSLHLACQSIIRGECELALAGGVNTSLHPYKYQLLSQGKFLSSDGRCRSFGEGGDGYVPGEGVGAVLLKSLPRALADGDYIYGVIKGSSINHGGKTNGYTVPNPVAQAEVIAQAYTNARLDPAAVSYLEAHGTGTSLGDPIEISGLSKVFKPDKRTTPYFIGSVKSNIGHCESAAGIAALTKVLMQLKHKYLVPSLHADKLNNNINWNDNCFELQSVLSEWKRPVMHGSVDQECPRIAGISSFGAGGSNAHIIIEEAPVTNTGAQAHKPASLLVLSAKSEVALRQKMQDLAVWLKTHEEDDISLDDISFTLNTGRTHFDKRCAIVADSITELKLTLLKLNEGAEPANAFLNVSGKEKTTNQTVIRKLIKQLIQDLSQASLTLNEYRDHLSALANFYIDGYDIELNDIYKNESHRKIPLPGYPFARERYWHDTSTNISQLEINASNPELPLQEQVMRNLAANVAAQLKIRQQDIDNRKNLSDYGMDSIHFVKLASHIDDFYAIKFTPALFYTCSSLAAISSHLVNEFAQAVTQAHSAASMPARMTHAVITHHQAGSKMVDDIAIIGMQGSFPQSADLNAFWEHLAAGHDLVSEIPAERWDWRKYYGDAKAHADKTNSRWGAFLSGVDQFDAGFFNLSAREANLMDPQQRLFLELTWKTIEDAGYDPLTLSQYKVGVFAGVEFNDYHVLIANRQKEFHGYIATGNSHSMLANRVSYFLNLQGPSEAIDTACSSSLVAIHRAVQAIHSGECPMAVAGGVSLILNPDTYVITSQLGALSADGRCKTFDKSANGYVKGEGVAAVLLKPLRQAQADGDHIYGIIKGTAVNHGGKAQSLTAPNALAQSDLLLTAYAAADIDPTTVTYIETHGTGTALGDPVEIEGLKLAFNKLLPKQKRMAYIALGSLKTNIGHLEPASGIAGLIKVLMAMQHGQLPGNVHLQELNPFIDIADSPFYVLTGTQAWQKLKDVSGKDIPYRAGISSFGFGGTNAHIVIEQGQARNHAEQTRPYYLITLSARHPHSLKQKIADLHEWLRDRKSGVNLSSLSFTLNSGRAHFNNRCALVVDSIASLLAALEKLQQGQCPDNCLMSADKSPVSASADMDERFRSALTGLKSAADRNDAYHDALMRMAELYCKQYPIAWKEVYANEHHIRIASLPSYPFIRQRYWFDQETPAAVMPAKPLVTAASAGLENAALQYLKNVFAGILRISSEQIAADETYEVHGVDSITGLEITERLEKDFGELPKTLLYERNTLQDLAGYFIKHHLAVLKTLVDTNASDNSGNVNPSTETAALPGLHRDDRRDNSGDIAIIGLSGTFPMSKDIHEFWQNLLDARDCIGEVPAERWNYKDYPVMVGGKEKYFRHGGFIPDVDKFDPLFFNISPRDAAIMDPQERLFMQSVWTTLEDAGYTREKLLAAANNEVGVFAGVTYNYYPLLIAESWEKGNQTPVDLQTFSVANRISYFLNLSGPSFVVDTACSSSLAAIHLAYESLLRGECRMAVAGGVNLSLHPAKYHFLGSFSFMSDEGRCTSFAEGGTGYVPSEGIGSVLLKPLADALRDNDRIYGVIKASCMNHGGKTSGYTVPNPNSQAMVIRQALEKGRIDPRSISYIEAHGTGTALGDPIEIRGLQDAFEAYTQDRQFCAIGSVKSNIGHLESAAGISQLAKVLLQMRHGKLVPSLHAEKLNPFINFAQTPFYVQRALSDWRTENGMPRRAGISSFGAGGTNVHLIVDEYSAPESGPVQAPENYLLTLSAMNAERLHEYTKSVYEFLLKEAPRQTDVKKWLRNVCYTAQTGRESMTARLAVSAVSYDELMQSLKACVEQSKPVINGVWINHIAQANRQNQDLSLLFEQQDIKSLAELWVNGDKIAWAQLYRGQKPDLVSIPTYPFAKRRCWAGRQPEATQTAVTKPQLTLVANHDAAKEKWLIFSDRETGFLLQDELGKDACLFSFTGDKFECLNENVYYINPDRLEDYASLFSQIMTRQDLSLAGMIYLWALDTDDHARANQRFLYLFQTLVQQKWRNKVRLSLITRVEKAGHASEAAEILQHHLYNLAAYFSAEKQDSQIALIALAEKKSLREQARCIAYDLAHMTDNKNHITYTAAERHARELVNPERFAEHETQYQARPAHKIKSDIVMDMETITALVTNSAAGMLGLEAAEIDPEVPYLNYGMDSIIGINFVADLNQHFPELLSPMDLYRYPNVSQLVKYILASCEQQSPDECAESGEPAVQSESEFMAEIAHLDNAQVGKLLEDELRELDKIIQI